jgi:hypothetical protein
MTVSMDFIIPLRAPHPGAERARRQPGLRSRLRRRSKLAAQAKAVSSAAPAAWRLWPSEMLCPASLGLDYTRPGERVIEAAAEA